MPHPLGNITTGHVVLFIVVAPWLLAATAAGKAKRRLQSVGAKIKNAVKRPLLSRLQVLNATEATECLLEYILQQRLSLRKWQRLRAQGADVQLRVRLPGHHRELTTVLYTAILMTSRRLRPDASEVDIKKADAGLELVLSQPGLRHLTGSPPIATALACGRVDWAHRIILRGNIPPGQLSWMLPSAVNESNAAATRFLLQYGVDPNGLDLESGMTTLQLAEDRLQAVAAADLAARVEVAWLLKVYEDLDLQRRCDAVRLGKQPVATAAEAHELWPSVWGEYNQLSPEQQANTDIFTEMHEALPLMPQVVLGIVAEYEQPSDVERALGMQRHAVNLLAMLHHALAAWQQQDAGQGA
jgi:hypothetical protein